MGEVSNMRIVPPGTVLAQFIKDRAQIEELSTHVEVSFSTDDANTILFMAERLLESAGVLPDKDIQS